MASSDDASSLRLSSTAPTSSPASTTNDHDTLSAAPARIVRAGARGLASVLSDLASSLSSSAASHNSERSDDSSSSTQSNISRGYNVASPDVDHDFVDVPIQVSMISGPCTSPSRSPRSSSSASRPLLAGGELSSVGGHMMSTVHLGDSNQAGEQRRPGDGKPLVRAGSLGPVPVQAGSNAPPFSPPLPCRLRRREEARERRGRRDPGPLVD